MHIETERKFLVKDDTFKAEATVAHRMKQGYIAHENGRTVRVRIAGDTAWLTIKGPSANGISRQEWEREIPLPDAEDLFSLCQSGSIDKTRYIVPVKSDASDPAGNHEGRFFEVDEFHGDNEGLVVAEIELGSENESFPRPAWLSSEVTGDRRYYNSHLCLHPFKDWK